MNENNISRTDFLKWWLVILSVLTGAAILFLFLITEGGASWLNMLYIVIPLLLFIAWNHYPDGNRKISTILSIILTLIYIPMMVALFLIMGNS